MLLCLSFHDTSKSNLQAVGLKLSNVRQLFLNKTEKKNELSSKKNFLKMPVFKLIPGRRLLLWLRKTRNAPESIRGRRSGRKGPVAGGSCPAPSI